MAVHVLRVFLLLWCGVAVASAWNTAPRQAAAKPNIVLILADDLGWADLPLYGNRFNETPRLDRLAAEGVRFTQFYAGPVCSPTRANLLSGRDQARFGITQHIPGHRRPFARLIDPIVASQLPLQVETYAERLRTAGYTTGYFGKWHLGGEGYGPSQQGWDVAFEHQGHTVAPAVAGGGAARRAAEVLAEKAVAFMEANRGKPFLLQISPYAVHIPLSARPELQQKYAAKKGVLGYPSRPDYAALLEELDSTVGTIVDAIDRMKLTRNTLLIFVSDNGGLEHEQNGTIVTSNAPLRGEKGTLYEGGIRVPALMRWPGIIPARAVSDTPATTMDVHPTLMEIAGAPLPADAALDGRSVVPVMRNPRVAIRRDALYWHLPHYHHSTPASAIRRGDWKLIEFFEDDHVELFNLREDPFERQNRAAAQRQKVRDLRAELSRWRREVGAQMPKPNPHYDPMRANELAGRGGGGGNGR